MSDEHEEDGEEYPVDRARAVIRQRLYNSGVGNGDYVASKIITDLGSAALVFGFKTKGGNK